jgi:hypothetical protein
MIKSYAFALLAATAVTLPSPRPTEVRGYGPWKLGMTREQVTAAAAEGPYSPVAATGGLETHNASFQGHKITASFVFDAAGLKHIQLWAYEGQELAKGLSAFHEAYCYLSEHLGSLESEGASVPAGLSRDDLGALIPAAFKTGTTQSQLGQLPQQGSIQAQVFKYHLHPRSPPAGAQVYASLIHSPQLGMYFVFVYFKSPPNQSSSVG